MTNRRRFVQAAGAAFVGFGLLGRSDAVRAAAGPNEKFTEDLKKLEVESGGRLGVSLLDTATGIQIGHRLDERFPMCSTFKVLAAGAILSRVDAGKEDLERRVRFSEADLVTYSPVTKDRTGGAGMSVAELCAAALTLSDNTAGNLLLTSLGGPSNLNAFVRTLGDQTTRLDRIEPDLNEALNDDPRDTTTPNAMASNLRSLALGEVLSAASRDRLAEWLLANKTGDKRLRAGFPAGWRVGDKTGSGSRGTANDVAVIWPPQRAPIIASVYLTAAAGAGDQQSATIAAVGRSIADVIGR
jgi:beta-lactamase class A